MNLSMELSTLFAHSAHDSIGQTRKDNKRPYHIHTDDVRARTAQVTANPHILAGADLHDVEEDVAPKHSAIPRDLARTFGLDLEFGWEYNLHAIENSLGGTVARYVSQLTDVYTKEAHPDKNRKTRKQLERERYKTFDREVKWIKLVDIASNLNDDGTVLESDGKVEAGFNYMFIKEKALCLPYLFDGSDEKNVFLYEQAKEILIRQAKKFDVRLS